MFNEHTVEVASLKDGKPQASISSSEIQSVEFNSNKSLMVVTAGSGVTIWALTAGKPKSKTYIAKQRVACAQFSPKSNRSVVAICDGNALKIVDAITPSQTVNSLQHPAKVSFVKFNTTGTQLVTVTEDHAARVWDAETGRQVGQTMRDASMYSADFGLSGQIDTWDGSKITSWAIHTGATTSDDGRSRLSLSKNVNVEGNLLTVHQRSYLHALWPASVDDDEIHLPEFSPDGTKIVARAGKNGIRIVDARTGKRLGAAELDYPPNSYHFRGDSKRVVVAAGRLILQLNIEDGTFIGLPIELKGEVGSARYSIDGARLIATTDSSVQLLDADSGQPAGAVYSEQPGPNSYRDAVLYADGKNVLAMRLSDAEIRDITNGKLIRRLGMPHTLDKIAVSGNRCLLDSSYEARLFDIANGADVGQTLSGQDAHFINDGKQVVVATAHGIEFVDSLTGLLNRRVEVELPEFQFDVGQRAVDVIVGDQLAVYKDSQLKIIDAATGVPRDFVLKIKFGSRRGKVLTNPAGSEVLILSSDGWNNWAIGNALPPMALRVAVGALSAETYLSRDERRELFLVDHPDAPRPSSQGLNVLPAQAYPSNSCIKVMSSYDKIWDTCQNLLHDDLQNPGLATYVALQMLIRGDTTGLDLLKQRSLVGDQLALIGMGIASKSGKIPGADERDAIEFYKNASARGARAVASFLLGNIYWGGSLEIRDRKLAIEFWKNAVELGNPYAAAHLAEILERGADPELPLKLDDAFLYWAIASKLFEEAGVPDSDDAIYARQRKATLSRFFTRNRDFDKIQYVWSRLAH